MEKVNQPQIAHSWETSGNLQWCPSFV